jgi:hypothetical protein
MDYKATLMALVLVSSALAGCTGDPDGGGNDEIDSDALQDLFDEHFEDFINNTTITVNNNYHNNTTYVTNEYHNTTSNAGDEVTENNFQTDYTNYTIGQAGNGSGSANEILFVMHMELNASEIAPELIPRVDIDPRTLVYDYTKNFTGYVWVNSSDGNGSSGWYEQAQISITHQVPCSVFYTFEGTYNDTHNVGGIFWDWNWNEYRYYWASFLGWNSSSSTSEMTYQDYEQAGYDSEEICNPIWNAWVASNYVASIGSIEVPQGYMISGYTTEYYHTWADYISTNGSYNITQNFYNPLSGDDIVFERDSGLRTDYHIDQYGGWDDLTVFIDLDVYYLFETSEFTITILYSFTPVIPVS